MRPLLLSAGAALLLLAGCASPWVKYEAAVRCHLDNKPDCDKKYKEAIRAGGKLQGIHASYGTHLLQQGKTQEAEAEFELERKYWPKESARSLEALKTAPAATATQSDSL